jgi:esterase/lipase superfamily enzyme
VPNMNAEWVGKLSQMDICIVTGETDNIVSGSQQMIDILSQKGIPHKGHIWKAPFGHDWPWWKVQIRHYVP